MYLIYLIIESKIFLCNIRKLICLDLFKDIPDSIFGEGWMSVSAGFFPQNKNDGCVGFFNQNNPHLTLTYLTPGCKHDDVEHDSFFYHKIEWIDMGN